VKAWRRSATVHTPDALREGPSLDVSMDSESVVRVDVNWGGWTPARTGYQEVLGDPVWPDTVYELGTWYILYFDVSGHYGEFFNIRVAGFSLAFQQQSEWGVETGFLIPVP